MTRQVLAATESNSSDSDCQTVTAGCRVAMPAPQINTANINKLIETLRSLKPERFNMGHWSAKPLKRGGLPKVVTAHRLMQDCGTCGCIGGWTEALFDLRSDADAEQTAAVLGLSEDAGVELFYPSFAPRWEWHRISARQAVRVLRHLRDTGLVDWSVRGRR